MKIERLETFMANAGLRNYLFIRLTTDTGVTGIGEASLEWQEKTVQTLIHEWVEGRALGTDPFDIELVVGGMIRDQYQGGATIMTAISGVEIAMWDIVGKVCADSRSTSSLGANAAIGCRHMRMAGTAGRAHPPSMRSMRGRRSPADTGP